MKKHTIAIVRDCKYFFLNNQSDDEDVMLASELLSQKSTLLKAQSLNERENGIGPFSHVLFSYFAPISLGKFIRVAP